MTPEQFDSLIDLIEHKINTRGSFGPGAMEKNKAIKAKQHELKWALCCKELEAKATALEAERMRVEMSDDQGYSNGSIRKIDDELRPLYAQIENLKKPLA